MKKIILICTVLVAHANLVAVDEDVTVKNWIQGIEKKVTDLTSLGVVINGLTLTTQAAIAQYEYDIKLNIYNILVDLQQMINPYSAIHKKFQGPDSGLAWYQRWFGFAFGPKNIYQYFEKYIFPLIQDAPLYQELADQGVQILVSTYRKEIHKQIDSIKKQFKPASNNPFVQAVVQLEKAFEVYDTFLFKNNMLLPVGSYNKIASSPLIRSFAFGAGGLGAGYGAASKLGLDYKKIMAEKAEMTARFARLVPVSSKIQVAGSIAKEGMKTTVEGVKKGLQDENVSGSKVWASVKQSAQSAYEGGVARVQNLQKGLGLKGTKGLEDIAATSDYTYQQAKYAIYGKILATVVATYVGYKTVQWLLKDWPRKKFTPSGQSH
jgi:hypothetical protein